MKKLHAKYIGLSVFPLLYPRFHICMLQDASRLVFVSVKDAKPKRYIKLYLQQCGTFYNTHF